MPVGAQGKAGRWFPPAALLVLLACGPFLSKFQVNLINFVAIYTIAVLGVGLLMGYTGQISIGQGGFMAVGAYTTSLLTVKAGLPPLVGLAAGVVLSAVLAALLGYVVLRLRGYFLALATMALGEIIFVVLREWASLTGGPSGIYNIPSLSVAGFSFESYHSVFYFLVPLTALLMLFQQNLIRSRTGRALQALHDGEVAAESLAIPVMSYKVLAFVIAGALAGLAGGLYAHYVQFISPEGFGMVVSIELLIMAMIGSTRSIYGPVLGAVVFFLSKDNLEKYLPKLMPQAGSQMVIVFFAVLLILIVVFAPDGLMPAMSGLLGRRGRASHDSVG